MKLSEKVARALAYQDRDGCFDRVDEWNAMPEYDQKAYPDEYPAGDLESCAYYSGMAIVAIAVVKSALLEEL